MVKRPWWYNYAETSKQILAYKGIILSRHEIIECIIKTYKHSRHPTVSWLTILIFNNSFRSIESLKLIFISSPPVGPPIDTRMRSGPYVSVSPRRRRIDTHGIS